MANTTLEERITKIITEQKINKTEFAKRLGITRNYVYLLTGGATKKITTCSQTLALLIEKEFGYPAEWVLKGETTNES
ncbi:MAG: helix-turn-helix domain-containing protein [Oscillospiraceae bacterium]|jgi:DNA-binding Xre family transcriptional regulator|nr:helix-turn-helix domain-containing protein [Oscillospiraceae bacterium]